MSANKKWSPGQDTAPIAMFVLKGMIIIVPGLPNVLAKGIFGNFMFLHLSHHSSSSTV